MSGRQVLATRDELVEFSETRDAAEGRRFALNLSGVTIYPVLFAIFPILSRCATNSAEVSVRELFRTSVPMIVLVVACWLALLGLFRNPPKAGLIVAIGIVFFWTFSPFYEVLSIEADRLLWLWVHRGRVSPWVLGILELGALFGISRLPIFGSRFVKGTTPFLNVFAVILLAPPIVSLATAKIPTATRPPYSPIAYSIPAPAAQSTPPDIYYIILDGYARSDVMKRLFAFDNEPFLTRLEQKGFRVARSSVANYCQTPLSLSSSLNGIYLDELVKNLGIDQTELHDLIVNNNLMATLRPLGYQFVSFATGFDPTEHPEADRYLSSRRYISAFTRMLIEPTPFNYLWPVPDQNKADYASRERIGFLFDQLPSVAATRGPKFVFAHVLCPHPPIIFNEAGESTGTRYAQFGLANRIKDPNGRFVNPAIFAEGYRGQAVYMTRRVEEVIDGILENSPRPPIIILQSDHGSELYLDHDRADNTDMNERMSILNAYYFPNKDYHQIHDAISPVNSFRIVLNAFFNAKIDLLPDRSYFSTWKEPYRFIDVSSGVGTPPVDPEKFPPITSGGDQRE